MFEVVDEKEFYHCDCNPVTLKCEGKMKGDMCRLRLVCRESKSPSKWQRGMCQEPACTAMFAGGSALILCDGHEPIGKLARLCRIMHATRYAAPFWSDTWLEVWLHESWSCVPCVLLQSRRKLQHIVTWRRLPRGSTTERCCQSWETS